MNCIGFLSIQNLQESEAGQPAKDGTAVGELLTEMIKQKTDKPNFGPYATNGVFLDQDMWYHASETYREICHTSQGNKIESEERIDWMTKAGITIRGQFDISYTVGSTLHIEDLKYGWGIVDVEKNWQLIGYAIGQLQRLYKLNGFIATHIHFKIHQPRPYHADGRIRSWVITYEELEKYWNQIEDRMIAYANGDRTLSTGKQCKYCEAVNVCQAMDKSVSNSMEVSVADWQDKPLSNEDLSYQMKIVERAKEFLDLKEKSLKQLATMRLQAGEVIPGFAFEMELGDRKWKEGVTPATIKAMCGVDPQELIMLSPNKAEKAGVPKKLVSHLTEKANKGMKIVKKDLTGEAIKLLPKPY